MARVDEFNRDVSQWAKGTTRKLKVKVMQLTTMYSGDSVEDLKDEVRKYYGEANRIGFIFPVYMIFVHKGAGRGYGGQGQMYIGRYKKKPKTIMRQHSYTPGSAASWDSEKRYQARRITNPASLGKMGTSRRVPKPWFNPVLEEKFPALSDLIATYRGEKIALNIQRILIK